MNLWARFRRLLHTVYHEPWLLRGSGAQHESSFEQLLPHFGIFPIHSSSFSSSRIRIPTIGYEQHPNGPQRWPDFHLQDERTLIPVELKSTRRPCVSIGGTWIRSDALYIMSHYPSQSVFISWGKDMKTEEEDRQFREYRHHITSIRPYKAFSTPVQWSSSIRIHYRLEEHQRKTHFERVMADLKRLSD